MPLMLWDDVPENRRRRRFDEHRWKGCPAAVTSGSEAGTYVRCFGFTNPGAGLCCAHRDRTHRQARNDEAAFFTGTIRCIVRGLRGSRRISDIRRLTDDDISAMRNVGIKRAAFIREIRDTWTDDQIRLAVGADRIAPDPDVSVAVTRFFATRPDVFAVMGG